MELKIDDLIQYNGKRSYKLTLWLLWHQLMRLMKLFFILACIAFSTQLAKSKDAQVQATAEFRLITEEQAIINAYVTEHCPNNWIWYCDKQTGLCQKGCR